MKWIEDYQLFLFDFDGLLVNTEELHLAAYQQMCKQRGFSLSWDLNRFSKAAHHSSEGLREQIYAELPGLYAMEPDWTILYAERKEAYLDLLNKGKISLMPGVSNLLTALEKANIRRCVVTHSALDSINLIKKQLPILDTIPCWITRENYTMPKPDPECYLAAIRKYSLSGDRIIGFEDVPRGLKALKQTAAKPVLICPSEMYYLESYPGIKHFPSFEAITDENRP